MLDSIKKQLKVQKWEYALLMCFALGGFVIGKLLFALIVFFDSGADEYFALGTVIAAAAVCMYAGIAGIIQVPLYFNVQISMGSTRKQFFISHYFIGFVMNILAGVLVVLLNFLENWLNPLLYPNMEQELDFLPYLVRGAVPAALAVTVIGGFCGAMIMKFGRKASVALWFLWMFGCLGVPHVHDAVTEAPDSLFGKIGSMAGRLILSIPAEAWILFGIVSVLAAFGGIWLVLRRQQVMN